VALTDLFPDENYTWLPWLFVDAKVNWKNLEMKKQYTKWLQDKLGFNEPRDWYNVSQKDFEANYGMNSD